MKDNITKEEFIAIVNSAMDQISRALHACDDVPEKYISLCVIDDHRFWNTQQNVGETILASCGYGRDKNEWEVTTRVEEEEDAEV